MANNENMLRQAIRKCASSLLVVIFFSLFINLLMFVAPLHMLQIYDRVLVSRSEVTLLVLTFLAIGLLMIYGLLEGVRSRILVRMGLKFDELVSSKMFGIIFDTALSSPKQANSQALKDIDSVRDFISGGPIICLCDCPWVPIFIAACFILHPVLGFVALIGAVLVFILAALNEKMTRRRLSEATKFSIQSMNYAVTSLRNAEIIKALGMGGGIKSNWVESRDSMLINQSIASDRAGSIIASSRFVRMGLQVTMLATGGYLAVQDLITPGSMIAASIIMGRALAPVEMAVSQWKNFVAARDSYKRLNELIDIQPQIQEHMDLPNPLGKLDLSGVTIRPPESDSIVVTNLSLSFMPGTVTGIIGPSGSGKSSLARVIVGVWPAFRGSVRCDGAKLEDWGSEKLGPFIGYMPQDVELFSGTVAENISRFQGAEAEEIVLAAKKAGVHELILNLSKGYDTDIGAGGQALSGGQRQRIALARAMYKSPRIIVLDEPNSNLDAAGEKALAETIIAAKESGATVIVISHRPALLASTDKVAVLNQGSLAKYGDRDQVLNELGSGRAASSPSRSPANN
jgi:PrtD family type I secretion system ABC transporter